MASVYLIDTSREGIKHQSMITRFGDSLDKKGISITPDPFREAYNLLSISTTQGKGSGGRDAKSD